MTPNARATAHQRVPVGRCGVALPVFPKNSQIFIIARAIITVNTVYKKLCLPSIYRRQREFGVFGHFHLFSVQMEMGPSQPSYLLDNLNPGGKYLLEIIIDTILGGDQSESTMANFTLGTPRSTAITTTLPHAFCRMSPLGAFTSSSLFYLFYKERRDDDVRVRLEKSSFFSRLFFAPLSVFLTTPLKVS